MELPGFLIKELRQALIDAFPSKDKLKILIRESDLKINIEEIVFGENLNDVIFTLIEWAENRNKLDILIQAASEENTDNAKLKTFVKKISLLDHWKSVKPILEHLNNQADISLIERACRCTLQNIDHNQDIDGNYPELIKLDISKLEKIFLGKCVYNNEQVPTIIEFVKSLAKDVQEPYNNQLNKWVETVASKLNIRLPRDSSTQETDNFQSTLKSYLLIVVEPKAKNQVSLEAELIPNYQSENSQNKSVRIDLETDKTVVTCSFRKIAQYIYNFIEKSRVYLYSNSYNLTIEVFLPFKYLHESIEFQEVNLKDKTRIIGCENPFVARSYERFSLKTEEYLSKLIQRWQKLEDFLNSKPTDVDVKNEFYSLDQFENCNFKQLSQDLKSQKKLGLKVTCCLPNSEEDKRKFFHNVFNAGIPICLWTRCNNLNNIDMEFERLLNLDALMNHLVDSVHQLRQKADIEPNKEDYLGYHLGFLCDNPNRIPSCFKSEYNLSE